MPQTKEGLGFLPLDMIVNTDFRIFLHEIQSTTQQYSTNTIDAGCNFVLSALPDSMGLPYLEPMDGKSRFQALQLSVAFRSKTGGKHNTLKINSRQKSSLDLCLYKGFLAAFCFVPHCDCDEVLGCEGSGLVETGSKTVPVCKGTAGRPFLAVMLFRLLILGKN